MLFSLKCDWLYMRLTECSFQAFTIRFPVTAALSARLQRQPKKRPHLGIERWNRSSVFLSSKAISGPFPYLLKMRRSQIRVENTLSISNFS
jgi:hypothetical protein